jgi:anaphase-promoting complex subunit 6
MLLQVENENQPSLIALQQSNANRRPSADRLLDSKATQITVKAKAINKLRQLTKNCLANQQYNHAIFFADKLVSMSKGSPGANDVYMLAQVIYGLGQHKRAYHLIKRHNLLDPLVPATMHYLNFAAQCLITSKQYAECRALLQDSFSKICGPDYEDDDGDSVKEQSKLYEYVVGEEINVIASLCVHHGKAYEGIGNRKFAIKWFVYALQCDVYCYEAYESLITKNMLTESEEVDLMKKMTFENPLESDWLYLHYKAGVGVYNVEETIEDRFGKLESEWDLADNLGLKECKARVLYYQNEVKAANVLTTEIRLQDPYDYTCLPIHIASMVQLKLVPDLHFCAHKLVSDYPSSPVSWFAVGCYYMLTNHYSKARRYFNKAKSMDNSFIPAWIGIGNAFAAQDESDQAMATYRSASRLLVGCHIPFLSMGMEYMRTNNFDLASQQFTQAMEVCKTDPLLWNEMGVWAFKGQNYEDSLVYFGKALTLCSSKSQKENDTCEVIYVNLAHSYRKLKDYDNAIRNFEMAVSYRPQTSSTYASLGFTYHLKGKLNEAVSYYHQALGLKAEDTFAEEMLKKALNELFSAPLDQHFISDRSAVFDSTPLPSDKGRHLVPPASANLSKSVVGNANAFSAEIGDSDEEMEID